MRKYYKVGEYASPSQSLRAAANREVKEIIDRMLYPKISRKPPLQGFDSPYIIFTRSYTIPMPTQFLFSECKQANWKFPLPKHEIRSDASFFEVYRPRPYADAKYLRSSSLKFLNTENFVNLLYLLSKKWVTNTSSYSDVYGSMFTLRKTDYPSAKLRKIIAAEADRRAYTIHDMYTMFHITLLLNIVVDTPNLLNMIDRNPRYLTAGDCTNIIFQLVFHPDILRQNRASISADLTIGTSESEKILSATLNNIKKALENSKNQWINRFVISFYQHTSDKYDELHPKVWCKLMLASTCISHINLQDTGSETRMKALTLSCLEKLCNLVHVKIFYRFPTIILVEIISSLSKYRRARLFRKAIVSMIMRFFDKESVESQKPDPHRLFSIMKSMHTIELLPGESSKIMSRLNQALRLLANPTAHDKKLQRTESDPLLGLTLRDITESMYSFVLYNKSLDPCFRKRLVDVFRMSIDTAQPMSVIQSLHRLSRLPSDFFLASSDTINVLISKTVTIVARLSPISLALLYGTLSKLSSKYYVCAVIEAVNKRILKEFSLSAFSPQEVAMLLESMARMESMRQKLKDINSYAQQSNPYHFMSNIIHMFSTETSPELASRLFTHVSSRPQDFSPTHMAIILNSATFLCDHSSKVQRDLYDSVSFAVIKQKNVYSSMRGKEIAVILAAFAHFSYCDEKALGIICAAVCKLKFVSESEISEFLHNLARIKFRSAEVLQYASNYYENSVHKGFQPENVRKALFSFAKAKYRPPDSLVDFFNCYPQLFDEESIKEVKVSLAENNILCHSTEQNTHWVVDTNVNL